MLVLLTSYLGVPHSLFEKVTILMRKEKNELLLVAAERRAKKDLEFVVYGDYDNDVIYVTTIPSEYKNGPQGQEELQSIYA